MTDRKIKVLYIHHHGTGGGASRSLAYLIQNFPANTVEAAVVTPEGSAVTTFKSVTDTVITSGEPPEISSIAGGKFYVLRLAKTLLNIGYLKPLKKIILNNNPDIVHLNEASLVLVARMCHKLGFKVVMHTRAVMNDRQTVLNFIIKKMISRYVDRVIAIDGSVQNKIENFEKSTIVYNPLHVSGPLHTQHQPASDGVCRVLFLANLIAYKGIFDLLQAAEMLRGDNRIKLFIAGSNSRSPAFFKSIAGRILDWLGIVQDVETRVLRTISEQDLKNVTFLGHIKDINEWLVKTDVLVFPSHLNGPSRSIFEAGVWGIPSILSLKDRIEDVVKHNENGIIIPEKDPESIAREIKRLAYDESLRERLGRNAKAHFTTLNDPANSAKRVLALYRELLAQ